MAAIKLTYIGGGSTRAPGTVAALVMRGAAFGHFAHGDGAACRCDLQPVPDNAYVDVRPRRRAVFNPSNDVANGNCAVQFNDARDGGHARADGERKGAAASDALATIHGA